jgi:hypothetical protein
MSYVRPHPKHHTAMCSAYTCLAKKSQKTYSAKTYGTGSGIVEIFHIHFSPPKKIKEKPAGHGHLHSLSFFQDPVPQGAYAWMLPINRQR